LADQLKAQPLDFVKIVTQKKELIYEYYSNCTSLIETTVIASAKACPTSIKKP